MFDNLSVMSTRKRKLIQVSFRLFFLDNRTPDPCSLWRTKTRFPRETRAFESPHSDEKGSQIGSLFLSEKAVFLFCSHLLEGFTKDVVAGVAGNGTLVLAPQEWPIVKILKVVGLAEQQAGSHVAGYE